MMKSKVAPAVITEEKCDSYLFYRQTCRYSPSRALEALRAEDAVAALPSDDRNALSTTTKSLVTVVIGIVTFCVIRSALSSLGFFGEGVLWIESPSGKTVKKLPLPIALRIVRKRGWHFAEVEPVKPSRTVSRREALGILLFGDAPVRHK